MAKEDSAVEMGVDPTEFAEKQLAEDSLENATEEPEELKIEELVSQAEDFREKYLRRTADLENLRKRFDQEKKRYKKYASSDLLRDLLEVVDNLERALDSLEFENTGVKRGVEMIYEQLLSLLDKYQVEPIEAEGKPFDPEYHEGLMREEREELDEQTVVEVFKKGYKLHKRILRPAAVKVGVPGDSN